MERTKKYKRAYVAGDFNSFGLAANPEDISYSPVFGKIQRDAMPNISWNVRFLGQAGSLSELRLYKEIAKEYGFDLHVPNRQTHLRLPMLDLRLDTTLTKGFSGDYFIPKKVLPGADHLSQSFHVRSLIADSDQIPNKLIKKPIDHQKYLKQIEDFKFNSMLKASILFLPLAAAIGIVIGGAMPILIKNIIEEKLKK